VRSRITTAVAVVVASAAWTMTAAAGNPHGVPPGQQKASDSTAATVSTSTSVAAQVSVKAQAKGHVATPASAKANARATSGGKAKGHVVASTHSSSHASVAAGTSVQTQTSASAGVKPSSTTNVAPGHNTHALASSNKTKLYGNGQTAGQIATQAGFGNAMLFGPGNSQPHKTNCGPHAVDVHALKAHAAKCTAAAAAAAAAASVSPAASAALPSVATQPVTATTGVSGAEASAPAKQSPHGGGVLGAKAELANATKPLAKAVLATVRKGTLPFTGLGLWLPVALGLVLIASGYGLRRKGASLT
jgi:hypothetical protein